MATPTNFHLLSEETSHKTDRQTVSTSTYLLDTQASAYDQDINLEDMDATTYCVMCHTLIVNSKVLLCLHSFCQNCFEKHQEQIKNFICPYCHEDFYLTPIGRSGCRVKALEEAKKQGTICVTKPSNASTLSNNSNEYLKCIESQETKQEMESFQSSPNVSIQSKLSQDKSTPGTTTPKGKIILCPYHKMNEVQYFCKTCNDHVCSDCTKIGHLVGQHELVSLSQVGMERIERFNNIVQECKLKHNNTVKNLENISDLLQIHYKNAKVKINDAFNFFMTKVMEQQQELVTKLENSFFDKQFLLHVLSLKVTENADQINQACKFHEGLVENDCNFDCAVLKKNVEELTFDFETVRKDFLDIEFVSNYQAIKTAVKNTFGYLKTNVDAAHLESNINAKYINTINDLVSFSPSTSELNNNSVTSNEIQNILTGHLQNNRMPQIPSRPILDSKSVTPFITLLKRQKMRFYLRIGEYAGKSGQFIEPTGLAVNRYNDVIIADGRNCKVLVFDLEGRCKFEFGDENFLPHRVAVVQHSGDIVVTERAPKHQIQIYNQYGQLIRKFGKHILRHPRGVAVDYSGRIIVVECKIRRAIIFDLNGVVLHAFTFSEYIEFPNSVAVNENNEIFISDNRTHCVKVFSYGGRYLRQIGRLGETSFPIAVGINRAGELLIVDNHNSLNLTIYSQCGQFLSAFESQTKHSKCLDVAFMDHKSLVVSTKDNEIFFYKYGF